MLLRNANSFVIILIYAPVSRRATHQRRRPTGGGGGGGFVYTLLAFAPEISCFPADCRRLRSTPAYRVGRTCLEALSGQGERASVLLVTCASTEVYIRLSDGMRRYHTRAERLYHTDEKSRLRAYDATERPSGELRLSVCASNAFHSYELIIFAVSHGVSLH